MNVREEKEGDEEDVQEPPGDEIDEDEVDTAEAHPDVGLTAQSSAAWPSLAPSSAPATSIAREGDNIVEEGVQGTPGSSRPRPAPSSGAVKSWSKRVGRAHGHRNHRSKQGR